MARNNVAIYHLSIRDVTAALSKRKRAKNVTFQESFPLASSKRPPLQHILKWIHRKTPSIVEAVNAMKENPGTRSLVLGAFIGWILAV